MSVTFTKEEFNQLTQTLAGIPTGYGWQAMYLITVIKQKNENAVKQSEDEVKQSEDEVKQSEDSF